MQFVCNKTQIRLNGKVEQSSLILINPFTNNLLLPHQQNLVPLFKPLIVQQI